MNRKSLKKNLREAFENLQVQSEELQAQSEEIQIRFKMRNCRFSLQTEELHEAYEAMSESEKHYRLLFDHSLDAIILTDPRNGGKILSANPAACQMLGWSEEELDR